MKRFLFLLLTVFTLSASAQTTEPVLKFGFLSYDTIIQSMDDYAFVESGMQALQEQYAAEQKRVEDEFNKKYEEFLTDSVTSLKRYYRNARWSSRS